MYFFDKFRLFLSWWKGGRIGFIGRGVFISITGKCAHDSSFRAVAAEDCTSACRHGWADWCCLSVLAGIAIVKYSIDQSGLVFNRHFIFLHRQYGLGGVSKAWHPGICLGKLGHALWRLLPGIVFVHQQS